MFQFGSPPPKLTYTRTLLFSFAGVTGLLLLFYFFPPSFPQQPPPAPSTEYRKPLEATVNSYDTAPVPKTRATHFGVFDDILVISQFEHHKERRQRLEKLRLALNTEWEYVWASEWSSPAIKNILNKLREVRAKWTEKDFVWPPLPPRGQDDPPGLRPDDRFPSSGAELWHAEDVGPDKTPENEQPPVPWPEAYVGLMEPQSAGQGVPLYPSRIAKYFSHMRVLRMISSQPYANYTALVLEDDVDFGWDIRHTLQNVFSVGKNEPAQKSTSGLPTDWDMLYLGHCSSLKRDNVQAAGSDDTESHYMHVAGLPNVRPSWRPVCSHAYALTRDGARRLLSQMRYPLFAFSRPVENAYLDLVHPEHEDDPSSARVRSFSFMPPLIVQVHDGGPNRWTSDVTEMSRDIPLQDSTLERVRMSENVQFANGGPGSPGWPSQK